LRVIAKPIENASWSRKEFWWIGRPFWELLSAADAANGISAAVRPADLLQGRV
jgi:hypothetical protein